MQSLTVKEALEQKKKGFYIGNRMILPFQCHLIEMIVDDEQVTEFVGNPDVKISHDDGFTSIYLRLAGRFKNYVNSYKLIRLIVTEQGADLCDIRQHIKIIVHVREKHILEIEKPSEDILFIE